MPNERSYTSGQILLITLLVLTIAMTIAISLIGRATSDVSMSRKIEETAQALNAAEAGIEQSLRTGQDVELNLDTDLGLTAKTTVVPYGGSAETFAFPNIVPTDTVGTLWLAQHALDGQLELTRDTAYTGAEMDICWDTVDPQAALLMTLYYYTISTGEYGVSRIGVDPASRITGFKSPSGSGGCGSLDDGSHRYQINFIADYGVDLAGDADIVPLAFRLRPVYNDVHIAVDPNPGPGTASLPLQGNRIESVGKLASGIERTVVVYQEYVSPPLIFDSAVVSQSDFTHN